MSNSGKNQSNPHITYNGFEVAVIGMSGRFPRSGDLEQFWYNLVNAVECISVFSDEELEEAGVDPADLAHPNYVKAGGYIEGKDYFDASFFGYIPAEAEIMDPQMRLFHECAWEALEDAGYPPGTHKGRVGLYAGAAANLAWEVLANTSGKIRALGRFSSWLLYDKDFMSTRVSYNLNLSGPAVNLHTACSTSLLAVHLACQGLLSGECRIGLAGGITASIPAKQGYFYEEGMISSPDGRCRPFDRDARGTVPGEGVGIVVLKLLERAMKDRDHIYAIVKSSAANNDGKGKVGFTAPGIKGQAGVIRRAIKLAGVKPESIRYIETHGTGTNLGDPAEIEGLKQAFKTDKKGFCRIGAVKSNLGHTDVAAGAAGLIKTVLALKHRKIPPTLNFTAPNPRFDLQDSPFIVNDRLVDWPGDSCPLRAGVSSFGVGGTNVHVVLEEAPEPQPSTPGRPWQLLTLSAKTETAAHQAVENLREFLGKHPGTNLADAAYTLQVGRCAFPHRRILLARNSAELKGKIPVESATVKGSPVPVVFMFPGEDSLNENKSIATGLYRNEPLFREETERCTAALRSLGVNEPSGPGLLFSIEYALAKLLMKWGITPYAVTGKGTGRITAACLSGVFSLEEALEVIVKPPPPGLNARLKEFDFGGTLDELLTLETLFFLETGPGNRLSGDVSGHPKKKDHHQVIRTMGQSETGEPDDRILPAALGRLWLHGASVDWSGYVAHEARRRVPLPTYPFERQYFSIAGDPFKMVRDLNQPAKETEPPARSLQPRPPLDNPYVAPGDPVEETVARIWGDFLGVETVGVDDDFFALGGDSLKGMTVGARMMQALDVDITLEEFFNAPTVSGVARYVRRAGKTQRTGLEPIEEKEYYPLSSAQARVFVMNRIAPESTLYNIFEFSDFTLGQPDTPGNNDLSPALVEDIWRKLILRHESLRTSFVEVEGEPFQKIAPSVEFQLEYHDLRDSRHLQAAVKSIRGSFVRPFDLAKAPLLRAGLLALPDRRFTWMVDTHHIISDGMSAVVLLRDFMSFYTGREPAPLQFQYKEFTAWQNRMIETGGIEAQETFWLEIYKDAATVPRLKLPTDYPRPDGASFEGASYRFALGPGKAAQLKQLASRHGVTLYMVLMAAFNVLLHKYTQQQDIIVGSGIMGRRLADLENIVGMFVNSLPIRSAPKPGTTFAQFLAEMKQTCLKAFENQDLQFETLVDKLALGRGMDRNPLFDVMLVVQNFGRAETVARDITFDDYDGENQTAKFDITLVVNEMDEDIRFTLEYSTALFKPGTIENMAKRFLEIIDQALGNNDLELKDFTLSHQLAKIESPGVLDDEGDFGF
ncbi:MAG: hypothetical protein GY940_09075 [bacterium]|nr:hypothetical protein [bacterium]